MGAGLRALPLSAQTVHLCVDMQLIFSEGPVGNALDGTGVAGS
jgi:hypothetical protein